MSVTRRHVSSNREPNQKRTTQEQMCPRCLEWSLNGFDNNGRHKLQVLNKLKLTNDMLKSPCPLCRLFASAVIDNPETNFWLREEALLIQFNASVIFPSYIYPTLAGSEVISGLPQGIPSHSML